MGDKNVRVDGESNIHVDDARYEGTDGLWKLIMTKRPDEKKYTFEDLKNYKDLVRQTNVINHPRNVTKHSRPTTTYKWKYILSSLHTVAGEGIHFLPVDIKGMTSKLNLLLAEYSAGNRTSTRNEIVSIIDELLRRKRISRTEYKDINSYLSKNA